MLAAFWSNMNGSVGTTTNLACIGSFLAMRFDRQVLMFENHLPKGCGLERALFRGRDQRLPVLQDIPIYYQYQGIDQLLKLLRAGYDPVSIDRMAITALDGRLKYLPLSNNMCSAVYEYELNIVIERLLWELIHRNDMVLVDTQSTGNLTTKVILDRADLVVVNLLQQPGQMEDFLQNYSGLKEKAVFLLGHYEEESIYNRINLSRMFDIPEERIWTIPENPLLPFLQEQGRIIEFMQKHLWTMSGEKNYPLVRDVRRAATELNACLKGGGT